MDRLYVHYARPTYGDVYINFLTAEACCAIFYFQVFSGISKNKARMDVLVENIPIIELHPLH